MRISSGNCSLAVYSVVTVEDVVDQRRRVLCVRHTIIALQTSQLGQHRLGFQPLAGTGLVQSDLTTAAKVELEAAEDGGGARQIDGDLANGFLGERRGGDGVHGGFL